MDFQFDLTGFAEGIQFTQYKAPSGHYVKHVDCIPGATRKLSLSLQLTDPKDYEGGDVVFHYKNNPDVAPKSKGTVIIFPSYVLHEVTPVTRGERYSLVAWITGPQFK
jgi:PKHD-type hydroxylase